MNGPRPTEKHPLAGFPQVCFVKNTVANPNIIIGDYTYYDDLVDAENFERNVLYHYPFIGDKLIIGRFCALATGVKFIMNGANHKISGFSTYPFQIFGNGWERVAPRASHRHCRCDAIKADAHFINGRLSRVLRPSSRRLWTSPSCWYPGRCPSGGSNHRARSARC